MSRCESVRPQTASEVVSKYSKPASRMTFLALRMQSACGRSPVPIELSDMIAAPCAWAAAGASNTAAKTAAVNADVLYTAVPRAMAEFQPCGSTGVKRRKYDGLNRRSRPSYLSMHRRGALVAVAPLVGQAVDQRFGHRAAAGRAAGDEDRDIAGGRAIDRDHVAAIVGQAPDRFRGRVVILEAGPPDGGGGLAHALLVRHVVGRPVVE